HLKLVGRPPFNRAVCGNYLEYTDQTIAFEPDDSTALINLDTADGTQSSAVRIDFAVTLQTGQPNPLKRANQFQVLKARIPAIKDYTLRRKATRVSRFDHRREVLVLVHRVLLLVKNAIVNRDVTITISPEQSNKVDAGNNPVMLARPMANNQ